MYIWVNVFYKTGLLSDFPTNGIDRERETNYQGQPVDTYSSRKRTNNNAGAFFLIHCLIYTVV